jgi:protein tyrosine phosphatase (PTP) superfamily phosphohydrolase (DUF442 family)
VTETALQAIRQYRRLDDRLATSGQPTAEQFAAIARAGFQVVINLAPPDGAEALRDEERIVTALGMMYIGIPVAWFAPTAADFTTFAAALAEHRGRAIWIHCIANKRVSAFFYLHRVLHLGWAPARALADLEAVWRPDGVWAPFIAERCAPVSRE